MTDYILGLFYVRRGGMLSRDPFAVCRALIRESSSRMISYAEKEDDALVEMGLLAKRSRSEVTQ